ncbi:MAG: hypothetical protein GY765_25700 [bacterium]|nr:hypothetical protein [bacterium]
MIEKILKFLDRFQWLFRMMKVDYPVFRAILWAKITSDNRRPHMNFNVKKEKGKEQSGTLVKSMGMNLFMGFMIGLSIFVVKSFFLANVFIFAAVMTLACMALISDFTSVLTDTTDNAVLLPRPVDGRTLLMSRITHIVIFLFLVVMSLALPTLIFGLFKYGVAYSLLLVPVLFFATLLVVFTTNVIFMGLLKLMSGEKFRDYINYIQVATMAIFTVGIHMMPRLLEDGLAKLKIPLDWWTCYFPPAWFAGSMEGILQGQWSIVHVVLAVQTVGVPLLGIFAVVRFLGPGFNRKLARIDSSEPGKKKKRFRFDAPVFFSRLLTRSAVERVGFEMTWKLVSYDRKFKLNVYPSLAMMLFALYLLLKPGKAATWLEAFSALPRTGKYVAMIYFSLLLIFAAITCVAYSDKFKAAWIYRALPIERPGELLSGAFKSLAIKMSAPFMVVSVIVVSVWGWAVVDDIVFGYLAVHVSCVIALSMMNRYLPFSIKNTSTGTNMVQGMLVMIVMGGLMMVGLLHYFLLTKAAWAVTMGNVVLALLLVMLLKTYRRTEWAKIKME